PATQHVELGVGALELVCAPVELGAGSDELLCEHLQTEDDRLELWVIVQDGCVEKQIALREARDHALDDIKAVGCRADHATA
ncbi:MAG TPA: hypothetical protein VL333_05195, partial [Candidatus Saccharimonadales bacterium]|nr:hypothetical protein [Candidatus Saccharimonadales bacterium]